MERPHRGSLAAAFDKGVDGRPSDSSAVGLQNEGLPHCCEVLAEAPRQDRPTQFPLQDQVPDKWESVGEWRPELGPVRRLHEEVLQGDHHCVENNSISIRPAGNGSTFSVSNPVGCDVWAG